MRKLQNYRHNLNFELKHSGSIYDAISANCYGICKKDMAGWGINIDQTFIMQLSCSDTLIEKNRTIDFNINVDQAKELVKSMQSFIRQCEKES